MTSTKSLAAHALSRYQVPGTSIYLIGLFDEGVTVLSQQRRALNLVWSLVESSTISVDMKLPQDASPTGTSIAIIGGGFSGLTFAAGLITKGFAGRIAIFEQRDTLLPLQNGSDTRWLHPNIYDWPAPGSEVNSAMLPLMNWTAARASDVAVQSIGNWRSLSKLHKRLEVYCNARHVRVDAAVPGGGHSVEWAGEKRENDGTSHESGEQSAVGRTEVFDHVILATGYGIEIGNGISYWRNDMSGQPNLERARLSYIVSGQGDGAMIDLLRLKISNFRQDRILHEMFGSTSKLRAELEAIKSTFDPANPAGLIQRLADLQVNCPKEFAHSTKALKRRLRRDTEVSLGTRVTKIRDLLESPKIRISFQNRVLVYFLYLCGGFFPVDTGVPELARAYMVPKERIVTRHGTDRKRMLRSVLLARLAEQVLELQAEKHFEQRSDPLWSGGYFGIRGPSSKMSSRSDGVKAGWRMEYLPGATRLLASTFCASIEGLLTKRYTGTRLRVTLHRAMKFGTEEVLQQCCPYGGTNADQGLPGRTFPAGNGTIGAAYQTGRIVRSVPEVSNETLKDAMVELNLNSASRKMSGGVDFLLAIPIVEPPVHTAPSPVAAVLYIDSIGDFFIDNGLLRDIVDMTQSFVRTLEGMPTDALDGIYNARMANIGATAGASVAFSLPPGLEMLTEIAPPKSQRAFQLNFESSDFIPVKSAYEAAK